MKRLLIIFIGLISCEHNDLNAVVTDCNISTLSLTVVNILNPTACNSKDAMLEIQAKGGVPPYKFSNGINFQNTGFFVGLSAGTYMVSVKDSKLCSVTLLVTIEEHFSTLNAYTIIKPDSDCFQSTGQARVIAEGGVEPYVFSLDNSEFSEDAYILNLEAGIYVATIKDALDCLFITTFQIPRKPTGISWSSDIEPIIDINCAIPFCHVSGTSRPDFTSFQKVFEYRNQMKTVTSSRTMPPNGTSLSQEQIALIACWVDDGALEN